MKKFKYIYITFLVGITLLMMQSCSDFLDLDAKNKIPEDQALSTAAGIDAYVANLYYQAPVEDFVFFPRHGFNQRGNTGLLSLAQYANEAIHSEWSNWNEYEDGNNGWWVLGYKLNRDINVLLEALPKAEGYTAAQKVELEGEALFLRAYTYFALAKRYGGVPLISDLQAFDPNFENLKRPRATEKETWDFVLKTCDDAIALLPQSRSSEDITKRRATVWAAYALKSRAALHAASVAKYWNKAPLLGEATDKKLVGGMNATDADRYYAECIAASEALMAAPQFGLHQANPANVEEATNNLKELFMNPKSSMSEIIFMKGYANAGGEIAHDYDGWNMPNQLQGVDNFPHRGRTNPILELVDLYEDYTATNAGQAAPIVTTTDGMVTPYEGYVSSKSYRKFNSPEEIFKNKDARFFASVIYPNASWKGQNIIIQGGIVKADGELMDTKGTYTHNGVDYYTFGAEHANQYSGFDGSADVTRSGFLMRKFLAENKKIEGWKQSTTDFMDMRYAEVLLNFAEAVIESGANAKLSTATKAINDIRRRAGHTKDIASVTLDQVLRERAVELAFENKGFWDLIRRRTYHQEFKNRKKGALVPYLDLRDVTPQYIFVRKFVNNQENTFAERDYYRPIPGTGGNGAVQNPQY